MDAKKGDWVQIRDTVLEAGERAPQVPADTAGLPLLMWVKVDSSRMTKPRSARK